MDSVFSFVVGLLTTALSLLGFVQQHPELPQASRDQVQIVAQQAITQATPVLTSQPNPQPASQTNTGSLAVSTTNGSAPLTVAFSIQQSAGGQFIDFGDGSNPCSPVTPGFVWGQDGCAAPAYPQTFMHTYTSPGVYKVVASRRFPSSTLGTATITVTSSHQGPVPATSSPISQSGTFTVPSTFTINKGQTTAQAGVNGGVTIKYKEYMSNPYERVLPGQEYCVNSTLSYVGAVATEFDAKGLSIVIDGENQFRSCNPNTASDPVLYNGLKISTTKFTSNSATYKVEFAPDSAQAAINQSSLSSNSSSPVISGTATNLKHVTVYIYKDPESVDPATIKIGDGVKSVGPIATTPGIVGYVDVVNGTWSTSFVQFNDASASSASLPDGVYRVNVAHPYSRYSLATGTLIIKTR